MLKTIELLLQINQELLKNAATGAISIALTFGTPMVIAQDNGLLPSEMNPAISQTSLIADPAISSYAKKMVLTVTAYSSTEDQTDDTPFITASNKTVYDGIVAANFLPFGTKIKIPKIFGDKIFVVEARRHDRFSDRVDVWCANQEAAMKFGKRATEIVIL